MIRYLFADALASYPLLRDSMFADRKAQFADRLGWSVTVADGAERDAYDAQDPLYVIWQRRDGRHGGSLRFLPSTGRTMLTEHFVDLAPPGWRGPGVWECTRFCLAPGAPARVAPALLLGALEMGLALDWTASVGVFDARMERVYRRLGWPVTVTGRRGRGRAALCAGQWRFDPGRRAALIARAGVSGEVARHWVRRGFGLEKLVLAA
ncbi:autoinducer synthase [Rhodobacteraceae bacterium CCMM004]|nr:autoinducer synthase [Rhodobacteraceae bacterium CCMM004]